MAGVWLEDPNMPGTDYDLTGLAEAWDKCEEVRHTTIDQKSMLKWKTPKLAGQITQETLQMNIRVVDLVVDIWCPKTAKAKTVNLDNLKWQAGVRRSNHFSRILFHSETWLLNFELYFPYPCPFLPQVKSFRAKCGLSTRPSLVHCKAAAIRGFITLIVRRHDGTKKRDPRIPITFF